MDKKCKKCGLEKNISNFHKDSSKKDGYRNSCKECQKVYSKEFYEKNNDKIKEYSTNYYNQHSDDYEFKLKRSEYIKNWSHLNDQYLKEYNKSYYLENRETLVSYSKNYRKLNNDVIKNYRIENKERIRKNTNEYIKNRISTDEIFKISFNIRNLIRISIKKMGFGKDSKSIEILGCQIDEFKKYIENKFEPWMNWENYGKFNGHSNYGWDIDHIVPISSAKTIEEVINLNHYTNMQPLCSYVNRCIKRNKMTHGS